MLSATTAYAMAGAPGGAAGGDPGFLSWLPLILMFAVFYFLLIRPQQKRNKEHRAMLDMLKRGDEVMTLGGIFGRITETAPDYLMLEIAPNTTIKVSRASVGGLATAAKPAADKKAKADDSAAKK